MYSTKKNDVATRYGNIVRVTEKYGISVDGHPIVKVTVLTANGSNLGGNANKAVWRRLHRMARKLHLVAPGCHYLGAAECNIHIYSAKDWNRLAVLVSFACGRSLAMTARNNCRNFRDWSVDRG